MSTEQKLGWGALFIAILSLIAALPLLFAEYIATGITFVGATLVLVSAFTYVRWTFELPAFTLLEVNKTLTFQDKNAHRATHEDMRRVKANHKGLTEFWFKGLGTDGSVENIVVDDEPPATVQTRAGLQEICKRFPTSLERGQEFKITASWDFIDSFSNNQEFYTHRVSTRTDKVRLMVRFHPEKRCTSASVYLQYGGAQYQLLKNHDLNSLKMEVK